ncbi:unnamed protein product [Callosobruchus maculatus]|uniref:Uncharacterized protein n=1 Tax=Callosobruchus maculatus TaxID=64391 RepID=A0A653CRP2_CALMS|nr:unnamed protein product [Callosobruchus maculatus]
MTSSVSRLINLPSPVR